MCRSIIKCTDCWEWITENRMVWIPEQQKIVKYTELETLALHLTILCTECYQKRKGDTDAVSIKSNRTGNKE